MVLAKERKTRSAFCFWKTIRARWTHIPALRDSLISSIVRVVVVSSVLRVSRIERLHSKRSSKVLVDLGESEESLLGREELRSDDHGDGCEKAKKVQQGV